MQSFVLECRQLHKSYGNTSVLHGVTFNARPGEIVGLIGASGGGKTTMLRLIAGFDYPDQGAISINGRQVASAAIRIPAEQRRVGMVFQEYALFPHLNVHDNIGFGLKGDKRTTAARVAQMLTLIGLGGLGDRMPDELSGGQQQRVALARALAPQPQILLLDEPFSNLDAALRAQVRAEVRAILKKTGVTCVFVTHDQQEALSFADTVAVLMNGRILQMDEPQALYRKPETRAVAAFIGESNFIPAIAHGESAQSALGVLPLDAAYHGEIDVLIRPESVRIASLSQGGIPARVMWREYYGHDQRFGLMLDDGVTEIIARAGAWQAFTEGDRVGLWVAPPVRAFPKTG